MSSKKLGIIPSRADRRNLARVKGHLHQWKVAVRVQMRQGNVVVPYPFIER